MQTMQANNQQPIHLNQLAQEGAQNFYEGDMQALP